MALQLAAEASRRIDSALIAMTVKENVFIIERSVAGCFRALADLKVGGKAEGKSVLL